MRHKQKNRRDERKIKRLETRIEKALYISDVYENALYVVAISDTEYQEAIERAKKKLAEERKDEKRN